MAHTSMDYGNALGGGFNQLAEQRFAPLATEEEQRLRDAEKERIWALIVADAQR